MSERVLVVAAHEDDETLGCGGAILRYRDRGDDVRVCIVTDGWSYDTDQTRRRVKSEDCRLALEVLGVRLDYPLKFPTLSLGSPESHARLNEELERIMADYRPTVVLCPTEADVNADHAAVSRSVEVACRPARPHTAELKSVLQYEVLSSTEWLRTDQFRPNVFVDITDRLERKIAALRCYRTEVRAYPHPRSPEGVRIQAQYRGLQAGMRAAEAFRLLAAYE